MNLATVLKGNNEKWSKSMNNDSPNVLGKLFRYALFIGAIYFVYDYFLVEDPHEVETKQVGRINDISLSMSMETKWLREARNGKVVQYPAHSMIKPNIESLDIGDLQLLPTTHKSLTKKIQMLAWYCLAHPVDFHQFAVASTKQRQSMLSAIQREFEDEQTAIFPEMRIDRYGRPAFEVFYNGTVEFGEYNKKQRGFQIQNGTWTKARHDFYPDKKHIEGCGAVRYANKAIIPIAYQFKTNITGNSTGKTDEVFGKFSDRFLFMEPAAAKSFLKSRTRGHGFVDRRVYFTVGYTVTSIKSDFSWTGPPRSKKPVIPSPIALGLMFAFDKLKEAPSFPITRMIIRPRRVIFFADRERKKILLETDIFQANVNLPMYSIEQCYDINVSNFGGVIRETVVSEQ